MNQDFWLGVVIGVLGGPVLILLISAIATYLKPAPPTHPMGTVRTHHQVVDLDDYRHTNRPPRGRGA